MLSTFNKKTAATILPAILHLTFKTKNMPDCQRFITKNAPYEIS